MKYNLYFTLLALWLAPAAGAQVCNASPVALPDEASFFGGPVVVDVLANDSDPDGEALAVLGLSTTCPGSASEDFGLVTVELTVATLEQACTVSYQVQDEPEWLLTRMTDRFAADHFLALDYSTPGEWRISDSHGRSHKVIFSGGRVSRVYDADDERILTYDCALVESR